MKLYIKANSDNEFNYSLLNRLVSDCKYFLGAGNRHEKHLWAGNVVDQIAKMRELYAKLPEKPEWLSEEDIDEYEEQMLNSRTITSSKVVASETEVLFKKGNTEIIKDGYGFGIDNGYTVNRFIIDNDGNVRYDYVPAKYLKDAVERLKKQGKFDNPIYDQDGPTVKHTLKYGNYAESVNAARNYGGAYDINPTSYFTKEDMYELGEAIVDELDTIFYNDIELVLLGARFENGRAIVTVGNRKLEFEKMVWVDMRTIRQPSDLVTKYTDMFVELLSKEIRQYLKDVR